MFSLPDIHTHDHNRYATAIINISPGEEIMPGASYSVGIHPWNAENTTGKDMELLNKACRHPQVVAIGETGLDASKGGNMAKQEDVFRYHIALSEKYRKPLIIHAVKTFPTIIGIKRQLQPTMPWVIHGFRGKPQLATELLNHGFYISLSEKFNPATATIIPTERLLTESDESQLSITEIAARISAARKAGFQQSGNRKNQ